eukprot:CAMPEP_0197253552 /NCGR_PEP_ID=MMETSP1429-20130617/65541_1 /TAXON_ID=49237 /ORGANISM="Chaetoceros  sp., Strain UNC1202" /LENGTH=140 /DNA_ID=CAMNT_0042716275 /DNA_START=87 /DNA_END=509 /DNA_ORIENTATION=+
MNNKLINGRKILVSWARQPKRGNTNAGAKMMAGGGGGGHMGPKQPEGPALPMAPPGVGKMAPPTCIPVGFAPSAQVTAAAKARATATSGLARTGLAAPRPGGGAIRRIGGVKAGMRSAAPKPYYPSSDPNRLGTRSTDDH